ncbi:MAG TPA: hypothetical protein VL978_14230 [Puia sp.]|nr:hypothetical protein [Puia sp.]
MKKLIGVIAILFTLLICVIYRHLTKQEAKARSEAPCPPDPLRSGLFFTALLLH